MRYASARDGAFSDTPIYDHVAWLLEQKYLYESASSNLVTEHVEEHDWFYPDSYAAHYPSAGRYTGSDTEAEPYYPSHDDYGQGRHVYAEGGRHRAYAA